MWFLGAGRGERANPALSHPGRVIPVRTDLVPLRRPFLLTPLPAPTQQGVARPLDKGGPGLHKLSEDQKSLSSEAGEEGTWFWREPEERARMLSRAKEPGMGGRLRSSEQEEGERLPVLTRGDPVLSRYGGDRGGAHIHCWHGVCGLP